MSPFVRLVQPSGVLDGCKARQLRHYVDDLVTAGVDIILIDLQNVTFVDSSGLGALIAAQRIVQTANCKLFLCSVNYQVKMLLERNKINRLFEIITDQEEFNYIVLSAKQTI